MKKDYFKIIPLLAVTFIIVFLVVFSQKEPPEAVAQSELVCDTKIPIGEAMDKVVAFLDPVYINLQNIQLTALQELAIAGEVISTIGEKAENCGSNNCQPNCVNSSIQGTISGRCGLGCPDYPVDIYVGLGSGKWALCGGRSVDVCIPFCYPAVASNEMTKSFTEFLHDTNLVPDSVKRCRGRVCPEVDTGVLMIDKADEKLVEYKNSLQTYIGSLRKTEGDWTRENMDVGIEYNSYAPAANDILGRFDQAGTLKNLLDGEQGARWGFEKCAVAKSDWPKVERSEIVPSTALSCKTMVELGLAFPPDWVEGCRGDKQPCGKAGDENDLIKKLQTPECMTCICQGSLNNWFCCH